MITITGRFYSKSFIKEGVGQHGEYRIIQFTIKKQENGKKIIIAFTAWGKWAKLIDTIEKNEKIRILCYPDCHYSEIKKKYYTELKVKSIEKWTPKKHYEVYIDNKDLNEKEVEFKPNLQLDFGKQETQI